MGSERTWRSGVQMEGGQAVSSQFTINNRELVKINSSRSVWVQHDITPEEVADVVKLMSQRIEKLEQENDAMRADLLLWEEKEVKP